MNKRHTIRNLVVALSLVSATLFISPVVAEELLTRAEIEAQYAACMEYAVTLKVHYDCRAKRAEALKQLEESN